LLYYLITLWLFFQKFHVKVMLFCCIDLNGWALYACKIKGNIMSLTLLAPRSFLGRDLQKYDYYYLFGELGVFLIPYTLSLVNVHMHGQSLV
jgi:hypothetical protein